MPIRIHLHKDCGVSGKDRVHMYEHWIELDNGVTPKPATKRKSQHVIYITFIT